MNKELINIKYGSDKVKAWKNSYDNPPPSLHEDDYRNPAKQLQYRDYQKEHLPLRESFKDIIDRVIPYYQEVILPDIKQGKKVLITAHSNSLRALIKHLDDISEQEIINFKIRNGVPLIYELDNNLKPIKRYYIDNKQYEDIFSRIKNPELDFIFVDQLNQEQEKIVYDICKKADMDFIPPLSARVDTVHKFKDSVNNNINHVPNDEGLKIFFDEIKKESFLFLFLESIIIIVI